MIPRTPIQGWASRILRNQGFAFRETMKSWHESVKKRGLMRKLRQGFATDSTGDSSPMSEVIKEAVSEGTEHRASYALSRKSRISDHYPAEVACIPATSAHVREASESMKCYLRAEYTEVHLYPVMLKMKETGLGKDSVHIRGRRFCICVQLWPPKTVATHFSFSYLHH
eukprot:3220923-Amphidinium_carterae.1